MPFLIRKIENEHMALSLLSDGSAGIVDKNSSMTWKMGPVAIQEESMIETGHVWLRNERSFCEQYPGRFIVKEEGKYLRYTLLGRERQEMGRFLCEVCLDGPWFVFRLLEIDENLPSLSFPPPIQSESLVIPSGVGRWIRKHLPAGYFWPVYSQLNMRWFGGLRGDKGLLAIFDEGYSDGGILARELSAAPCWLKTLDRWETVKSVRYRFTGNGYVGLAKAYKAWVAGKGLFRSLKEKMEACPALKNFHGGRMFSVSQASAPYDIENIEDLLKPVDESVAKAAGKIRTNFDTRALLKMTASLKSSGMFPP